jgi:broad specificity phosphatase PhoE
VMKTLSLIPLVLMMTAAQAAAQHTVFLVRHAERADSGSGAEMKMATDPDLSDVGRARAASLAAMLKDAKIVTIVSTEYKRSQQTAAPLAKALGLQVTTVKAVDVTQALETIKASAGNVLVVGHSNTIPDLMLGLGAPAPDAIRDDEFDNLYLVTLDTVGTRSRVLRLHYKQ